MPNSVTSIGKFAFHACDKLTNITLSSGVKTLDEYAISSCSKLASITYKGQTYTNKTKLTNALTSNGVSVENGMFVETALQ